MALANPVVALIGRPNVGKSTLFNRLLKENRAVVEDTPGVTRDRNYGLVERFSIPFVVVDTGGIGSGELQEEITKQSLQAYLEADIAFVLFDGKDGVHPEDEELLNLIRKASSESGATRRVVYTVNKCDASEQEGLVADFYRLGLDGLQALSARHGYKVNEVVEDALKGLANYKELKQSADSRKKEEAEAVKRAKEIYREEKKLLEEVEAEHLDENPGMKMEVRSLPEAEEVQFAPVFDPEGEVGLNEYEKTHKYVERSRYVRQDLEEDSLEEGDEAEALEELAPIDCIKVAVVGRPNVGKSTLINRLIGEERLITSDIAGTTRDAIDIELTRDSQKYLFVDTAGLRKKAKVDRGIEKYSTLRTVKSISSADVCVLMIDADIGVEEQETKILGLAHEQGKGVVIAVNKWDSVEKDHRTVHEYTRTVKEKFKFAPYAPILFISALSGRRCPNVIEAIKKVAYERTKRVSTNALNRLLKRAVSRHSLPAYRGKLVKLFYATQVDIAPPRFILVFNQPKGLHFSNMRYLKNAVRDRFGFEGSDIKLVARKKG